MTTAIVGLIALLLAAITAAVVIARRAATELKAQDGLHNAERWQLRAERERLHDERLELRAAHDVDVKRLQADLDEIRGELGADGYRALVGRRVTANVRDGGAIRGVLTRVYADAIVISHPEFVGRSRPADIGAEVTLDRASVPMLQRFASDADDATAAAV